MTYDWKANTHQQDGMSIVEVILPPPCVICGEDAVTVFGYDPICANVCCKHALIDKINDNLQGIHQEQIYQLEAEMEGDFI